MSFWWGLSTLVLLALSFVLLPLRRTQTASNAPSERWLIGALATAVPLVTLSLYLHLGAPAILGTPDMLRARGEHDVDGLISALEARLQANPQDAQALYVLGRSYLALQRNRDAQAALAKAASLAPKEARILAQYAEVLALNDNGNLQGAALQWVEQALKLDAQDEKALELAGLAAYQREDWAQAVHFWRRLIQRLPAGSEFHQDMAQAISDAQEKSARASGLGDRAKLQPPAKKQPPH